MSCTHILAYCTSMPGCTHAQREAGRARGLEQRDHLPLQRLVATRHLVGLGMLIHVGHLLGKVLRGRRMGSIGHGRGGKKADERLAAPGPLEIRPLEPLNDAFLYQRLDTMVEESPQALIALHALRKLSGR